MTKSTITTMEIIGVSENEKPRAYQRFHGVGLATKDIIVKPAGKNHYNMIAVKHL